MSRCYKLGAKNYHSYQVVTNLSMKNQNKFVLRRKTLIAVNGKIGLQQTFWQNLKGLAKCLL
jgi:hypothetical protein